MDYLPTLINAAMIGAVGALITFVTRTQIRDLKREIDGVKQEIRDLRIEIRAEFTSVRGEIASLRSDLTQVALAVGARPQPQTG